MAVTIKQLESLGFVHSKRSSIYNRKYDTLVYPVNDTDFIYLGYNQFTKAINNKILWKSFKAEEGERITYPIIHLGDTSLSEVKSYLERSKGAGKYLVTPPTNIEVVNDNTFSPEVNDVEEIDEIPEIDG